VKSLPIWSEGLRASGAHLREPSTGSESWVRARLAAPKTRFPSGLNAQPPRLRTTSDATHKRWPEDLPPATVTDAALFQWPTGLAVGLGLKETTPPAEAGFTPKGGSPVPHEAD
jgi:hypothetical protein